MERRRYNVRHKNEVVRCRITSAEKRRWEHYADGNLSEWLRRLANAEVERVAKKSRKLTVAELLAERVAR
jgi:hypothetical protein